MGGPCVDRSAPGLGVSGEDLGWAGQVRSCAGGGRGRSAPGLGVGGVDWGWAGQVSSCARGWAGRTGRGRGRSALGRRLRGDAQPVLQLAVVLAHELHLALELGVHLGRARALRLHERRPVARAPRPLRVQRARLGNREVRVCVCGGGICVCVLPGKSRLRHVQ